MLRRLATIAALLLVLATLAPMLACLTGGAMTREESACCKSMQMGGASRCGAMGQMGAGVRVWIGSGIDSGIGSGMGCCRTEARTETTPQLASIAPAIDFRPVLVLQLDSLASSRPVAAMAPPQRPIEHFPPGLLTAKTTVLRI